MTTQHTTQSLAAKHRIVWNRLVHTLRHRYTWLDPRHALHISAPSAVVEVQELRHNGLGILILCRHNISFDLGLDLFHNPRFYVCWHDNKSAMLRRLSSSTDWLAEIDHIVAMIEEL